ncbi:DUF6122 family protein [Aquimarina hainanensis]|uniref:DUF6122 family protein n=1 Tax=Aquimarina hainanensis TaxID=1578017 RepID=A0ABW5N5C2_9FLAO|nr:DUF6122 family protein [Aquimarina sp. TRL1]QKX05989.1 hypothetical protein HN014_14085 [Aquimarina sp. TRL1]
MTRFLIHYGCHFIIPVFFALIWYPKTWKKTYLIFLAAMLIDLDHLFANPVFDPNRCSVGFHYLHTYIAIGSYFVLTAFKKTRLIGFSLLWHILTDQIDCWLM